MKKRILALLYENGPNWMTVTEIRNKTGATIDEYQMAIRVLRDCGYVETQNLSTGLFGSARITNIGVDNFKKP